MNLCRFLIVVLSASILSRPTLGQTVTVTNDGIFADGKPITVVSSTDHDRTEHGHLTVDNHCSWDVVYEVRIDEATRKFILLHAGDGKNVDLRHHGAFRLNTQSDRQDVFSVSTKEFNRQGVYQGTIRIEAWSAETRKPLGHAEVPIIARLESQRFPRQRPADYEMWTTKNGRLRRVRTADLPLRVYSNDRSRERLVERAITVWNQAGATVDISRPFFRRVDDSRNADLTIDWSGRGLPDDAAGIARLGYGSVMRGIVLRGEADDGRLAETLVQELGHILGLEHSGEANDIMAPTVHSHWHALITYVELTSRDLSALWWLYRQNDYEAILPPRNSRR